MDRGAVVAALWGIAWVVGCTVDAATNDRTATRSGEGPSAPGLVGVLDAGEANDVDPAPPPSPEEDPRNVSDALPEPPVSPPEDAGAPVEPNPPEPDEPSDVDPSLGDPDAPTEPGIEPVPTPMLEPSPEPIIEPMPEPIIEPMVDGGAPVRSTTGPSFAETVGPILNVKCTPSCHEPGGLLGGPGGLGTDGVFQDLTLNASYETLTTRPSVELPTMWLVGAGLDDSYLWHKLNDTYQAVGGKGAKMPVTGELTAEELEAIRAWIEGGASP